LKYFYLKNLFIEKYENNINPDKEIMNVDQNLIEEDVDYEEN